MGWLDKYKDSKVAKQDATKVASQDPQSIYIDPDTNLPLTADQLARIEAIQPTDQGTISKYDPVAKFKKKALHVGDVATDIMQLGHFVPNPIAQWIAAGGDVAGAAIDTYQAAQDIKDEKYGSAAINTLSALLPLKLNKMGYMRDMWNTEAGSLAEQIAKTGSRSGSYIPLTPYSHLATNPNIQKGILENKTVLGAVAGETAIDYENGGWLEQYADGGNLQEHQPNFNDSHVSIPPNFVGQGHLTTGRNWSPAWGGQFENGGLIPKDIELQHIRNGAPSEGKHAKKTMPSAENGMSFYQNGLDWKPNNISKDGSQLKKLDQLTNFNNFGQSKKNWLEKYSS